MDWLRINHVLLMILISQYSNQVMVRCEITDVRLFGGPSSKKGTVEYKKDNGTWETTCGTNFDIKDVIVICKQLGFPGASRPITDTPYEQNAEPISGLQCIGVEADLSECPEFTDKCLTTAGAASCHGEGYLGCFKDNGDDRVLPGVSLIGDNLTIVNCIQFCSDSTTSEYTYAGVEHGRECYCGEAGTDYDHLGLGTDSDCQFPCSGDLTDSCGGIEYIAVFKNSSSRLRSTDHAGTTETMILTSSQGPFVLPQSGTDAGLYGGIGGGLVGFVVFVIIIIAIILIRRRSRYRPKTPSIVESSPSPQHVNTNDYGISHATMQHTSGAGGSSVNDHSANRTTTSAAASGEDKQKLENNRQTMNVYDGIINDPLGDEIEPYASIEGFGATSATPNKPERMSVVYAAPDKSGNGPRNDTSEDFGPLYSMPEKARGEPDGYEEKKPQVLYAMPDKSSSRDQYESGMVENELYTV